jgi:hypothetical protein
MFVKCKPAEEKRDRKIKNDKLKSVGDPTQSERRQCHTIDEIQT